MVKYIQFDSIDEYGIHIKSINNSALPLIKLASTEYSKEVMDAITSLKREAQYYYVVINALGSYEIWGANRNGDAFPREGLAHYSLRSDMGTENDYGYKTFEYYAHLYKHHCFDKTSLINTDEGLVKISDIKIGDIVRTHTGSYEEVINTFKRKYSGNLIKFYAKGKPYPIICTPEDQFQIVKKQDLLCAYHKTGRNFCTWAKNLHHDTCCICGSERKELDIKWVKAEDIQDGDLFVSKYETIEDQKIENEKELGFIYGAYLSEGCFLKKNNERIGIQICFGKHEDSLINRLKECCDKIGLKNAGPYIHKQNNTALITIHDKNFAESIYNLFGEYSNKKFISRSIFDQFGKVGLLSMVGSYIDGDGHSYKSESRNSGILRVRSTSPQLLLDVADILEMCGIPCSVNFDGKERPCFDGKYTSMSNGVCFISHNYSYLLKQYLTKIDLYSNETSKSSTGKFKYDDYILTPVCDIDYINQTLDLYNLEVANDNSYQINGINVHNCNKDPKKSFGKVVFSYWNTRLERVELIVGIDREKGKDIIEAIENDDLVSVSMGAKLKFDECCICGQKSKTTKEYCKHLKHYMGRIITKELADQWSRELGKTILPGSVVFAWNYRPRFFDISKVFVGAEPTAFVLGKAASTSMVIPSACIAEAEGMTDEIVDDLCKSAAIYENMGKHAILKKDAEIDKVIEGGIDGQIIAKGKAQALRRLLDEKLQNAIPKEEPISNGILDLLATRASLPGIFSTMVGLGIHPKPAEFQRIVIIHTGNHDVADFLDRNHLVFDPNTDVEPTDIPIGEQYFDDNIAKLLSNYMVKRSCFPDFLEPRLEKQAYLGQPEKQYVLGPKELMIGVASLFAGMKLKAMGFGADQMLNIFRDKPWIGTLLGAGLAYKLLLGDRHKEINKIMIPANNYENAFMNTYLSGHPMTKTSSVGGALALGALAGLATLPAAYVLNAYHRKSLYDNGKQLFPGSGITPPHAAQLVGGGTAAGLLMRDKYGKQFADKLKLALKK